MKKRTGGGEEKNERRTRRESFKVVIAPISSRLFFFRPPALAFHLFSAPLLVMRMKQTPSLSRLVESSPRYPPVHRAFSRGEIGKFASTEETASFRLVILIDDFIRKQLVKKKETNNREKQNRRNITVARGNSVQLRFFPIRNYLFYKEIAYFSISCA